VTDPALPDEDPGTDGVLRFWKCAGYILAVVILGSASFIAHAVLTAHGYGPVVSATPVYVAGVITGALAFD